MVERELELPGENFLDIEPLRFRGIISAAYRRLAFRDNGEKGKYFTSDKVQLQLLRSAKEKGVLPFGTTIGVENFGKGVRYTFN